MKQIVTKLKSLIDANGPKFLNEDPYSVYTALIPITDQQTASKILYVLLNKLDDYGIATIQKKCCLNKKAATQIADIFASLYSKDNRSAWAQSEFAGLHQFLQEDKLSVTWEGSTTWYPNGERPNPDRSFRNGYRYGPDRKTYDEILEEISVVCSYEAHITFKPIEAFYSDEEVTKLLRQQAAKLKKEQKTGCFTVGKTTLKEDLVALLGKNPYMSKKDIVSFFTSKLLGFLDDKFEWFCTGDDYYPPVAEDFEADEYTQIWCKENGFELVKFEGHGSSL